MTFPQQAVFDSYALLCFLKSEKGAHKVQCYLEEALRRRTTLYLNMINAGEIFYITYRKLGEQRAFETWGLMKNLPVLLVHSDENLVLHAAHLKARFPFSYADAFAAATALKKRAVLVTGDPEFKKLGAELEIDWLR